MAKQQKVNIFFIMIYQSQSFFNTGHRSVAAVKCCCPWSEVFHTAAAGAD